MYSFIIEILFEIFLISLHNHFKTISKDLPPWDFSQIFQNHILSNSIIQTSKNESIVNVIYTGGTIGMMRNKSNVLAPFPNVLENTIRNYPNMHDKDYSAKRFGSSAENSPLVLPYVEGVPNRVLYTITEYEPLLDSSNMTVNDWVRIGKDIQESYQSFDAFVVLHGTDTLAYTASALSFMLENLGKTVIITGAQVPIFETRTDGKDNFCTSLIIAANFVIPEVCVFYGNKLLRGNRTSKVSGAKLEVFESPNCSPLGRVGVNYEIDYRLIFRPSKISFFDVHTQMDVNVGILRLFPSVSSKTFRAFLAPPLKGAVLQTFGAGNVPSNRQDILDELEEACKRGVLIVNIAQCPSGTVTELYDTGSVLTDLGVIMGNDMTPEAALTKLSYVIGKTEWTLEHKKQVLQMNIRGELTSGSYGTNEYGIINAVARSLKLSSTQELSQLCETLLPAMVNTAVLSGDLQKISELKSRGANMSEANEDYRTPLHIACREGDLLVIYLLLQNGAPVHRHDRHDRTALMEAIDADRHEIITLLRSCGASLTEPPKAIGEKLCSAASYGLLIRLRSFELAGANLSEADPLGRTALHVAALHGYVDIVKYLLQVVDDVSVEDRLRLTPLDYAKKGKNQEIIRLIANRSQ